MVGFEPKRLPPGLLDAGVDELPNRFPPGFAPLPKRLVVLGVLEPAFAFFAVLPNKEGVVDPDVLLAPNNGVLFGVLLPPPAPKVKLMVQRLEYVPLRDVRVGLQMKQGCWRGCVQLLRCSARMSKAARL